MPRKPRFIVPGMPQHVIIRGVNRDPIFCQAADYRYYRERLIEALQNHDCTLHAYVLMTNHVHLLITPTDETGLAKTIQRMGRYYVQYFNQTHGRTGTLWEGRYKSALVDSEQYLLSCYRYIELNPIRASMVTHPAEYPWSSYRCNALGRNDTLITPHAQYLSLGSTNDIRQHSYRGLFDSVIPTKEIAAIRNSVTNDWVLGSQEFKKKIEQQLQRRTDPLPRGGDRRSINYRDQRQINRY